MRNSDLVGLAFLHADLSGLGLLLDNALKGHKSAVEGQSRGIVVGKNDRGMRMGVRNSGLVGRVVV